MSRGILDPFRAVPPSSVAANAASRLRSRRAVWLGPAAVAVVVLLAVGAGLSSFLIPGTLVEHDAGRLAAGVIFAASYLALAIGHIPGLAIEPPRRALGGAPPLVLCGRAALRRPLPAVAMASNIGSTATITGNPQNMMIGSFSRISYVEFAAALAPVALCGLIVTIVVIALLHRREFARDAPLSVPQRRSGSIAC